MTPHTTDKGKTKEEILKEFRKSSIFYILEARYETGKFLKAEDWLSSSLDAYGEHIRREMVEKIESFFTPATGTRGQGGLPITGTVTDWEFTVTKNGWKMFKENILHSLKLGGKDKGDGRRAKY